MSQILADAYRGAHRRIDAHVRSLVADGHRPDEIALPACPGWTVQDAVAHLAANAVDLLSGRLTRIPDPEWTARQVAERAGRPVTDVLDEWAPLVDGVAADVLASGVTPPAADALTHEGDILEAQGAHPPADDGWRPAARLICRGRIGRIDLPGSLVVTSDGDTWTGGSGQDGPSARVDVPAWELFRGVMSRRSPDQMRAWAWDGDPDPWLARLPVFGPRGDRLPAMPVSGSRREPGPDTGVTSR